jgi:hypothetical protein
LLSRSILRRSGEVKAAVEVDTEGGPGRSRLLLRSRRPLRLRLILRGSGEVKAAVKAEADSEKVRQG